jgi:AcrR family transcriptional regulator
LAEGHGTVHPRQPAGRSAVRRPAPTYGGDLRRDLPDAALELIARQGPSAVSLRWLARRLGVSHAAPANHFPDKAALFTAIALDHPAHVAFMWQRDLLPPDDPALAAASDATFALLLTGVRDVQAEGWAAGADPRPSPSWPGRWCTGWPRCG